MRFALILAMLLVAMPVQADALDDLRSRLESLTATTAVEGGLGLDVRIVDLDDSRAPPQSGAVGLHLVRDANGLQFEWRPETLRQAAAEAQQVDPDAPRPVRRAMGEVSAADISDLLDAAASMQRLLRDARLLSRQATVIDGQPGTLLRLRLQQPLERDLRQYIRHVDATAQVWLDQEGWPVRLHREVLLKGRAFLVISFEFRIENQYRYRRFGDRLVAVEHRFSSVGNGGGESQDYRTNTTLELRCREAECAGPGSGDR